MLSGISILLHAMEKTLKVKIVRSMLTNETNFMKQAIVMVVVIGWSAPHGVQSGRHKVSHK